MSRRRRSARTLATILLPFALAFHGCSRHQGAPRAPLVVVGIDGGERRVIEALWARGELPALRALADAGSFLPLRTSYGKSPVIWTSIATGVRPELHGIEDFVVATPGGDVPVSSAARKRPALWNLLERVHRRSAVLGWWATWPAETVEGSIVVSDRAGLGLADETSPPERAADVARWIESAKASSPGLPLDFALDFGDNDVAELHDRIVVAAAKELVREPFDLVLAYFRSADVVSHWQWHTFQPEKFPGGAPPGAAPSDSAEPVLDVYRTIDRALASIVAAAPPETSWLVLSDHGFRADRGGEEGHVGLHLDFDRVLEALGFLFRAGDGTVDPDRSRARTHSSPPFRQTKLVRLRETLTGAQREQTLQGLTHELARVRFPDGSAAFAPRSPNAEERGRGADLAVPLTAREPWDRVELDGAPIEGAVLPVPRLTGTHDEHTAGILIASGPLFAKDARPQRVHVHDVAPTILVALGLPIADDFAGEPCLDLFRPEVVAARPVRRIASWGTRESNPAPTSPQDQKLLDDLAALGYLK